MTGRTLAEEHGTYSAYTNRGCRCDECRAANRAYKRAWEARRQKPVLAQDSPLHGTVNGHKHYGCRCEPCVEAKRAKDREDYQKDPARKRASNQAWIARNDERYRARRSEYYAENREENRARRREIYRRGPDAYKARARKRQLLVRGVEVEQISRDAIWARDGGICHICSTAADVANWHLDHIVALNLGGQHTYENVAVSHPRCNREKGAKPWPAGR